MNYAILKKTLFLAAVLTIFLTPSAALAGRTIPVTVTNLPETVATVDVDSPVNQPFQFSDYGSSDIPDGGVTVLGTGMEMEDPVPEGKRLVIQHISFSISGTGIEHQPQILARVIDESFRTVVEHPIPLTMSNYGERKVLTASLPITLYVEEGQKAGILIIVRTSKNIFKRLALTGYYVDVD